MKPIDIVRFSVFSDNYIWLLHNTQHNTATVVDPGDAKPVILWLRKYGVRLTDIIVTHHHPDHVAGIEKLLQVEGPSMHVHGSAHDKARQHIPGQNIALSDNDCIHVLNKTLSLHVIDTPGHTLGHLAYYAPALNALFCGDTLFLGGCGRLFEGTPTLMHNTLNTLSTLPSNTRVYCAHEYTEQNYKFGLSILPNDQAMLQRAKEINQLKAKALPTVPATLAEELRDNIFLRCAESSIQQATNTKDTLSTFTELRRRRDHF